MFVKYLWLTLLAITVCNLGYGQTEINKTLSKRLDSLRVEDQKWRKMFAQDSSQKAYAKRMFNLTDSLNLIEAKSIFKEFGLPTISMVGEISCHNFYLLVLHADEEPEFQRQVLKQMKSSIKSNDCARKDYAYLTDRYRLNNGRKQIYGTQIELNESKTAYQPKRLKNPKRVNKRRQAMEVTPFELEKYYSTPQN